VHQATTILDQKYKKFQCLGLDWDNLTVFQQAKAIEVNLNVVAKRVLGLLDHQ